MIPKSQMYLGARIVENDPEEETPVVPYKGTVTAIEETGKGELDYFVYIHETKKNLPLLPGQDHDLFSMDYRPGRKTENGAENEE